MNILSLQDVVKTIKTKCSNFLENPVYITRGIDIFDNVNYFNSKPVKRFSADNKNYYNLIMSNE